VHPQDARTALQRLAYKKFHSSPLFLEWAPVGCLKDDDESEGQKAPNAAAAEDSVATTTSYTAYITNIPFNVSEDSIRLFLQDVAPRLNKEGAIARVDYLAEKGQAFVTVSDESTLQYLVAKASGRTFDGRTIGCQVSTATRTQSTAKRPKADEAAPRADVPAGCDPLKLVVKNLPFEATEADLRQLFASFSEVKAVRVPRKNHQFANHRSNNHRGFGFVEFLTEQEATNALQSLTNTHLYGRHLVLQYAAIDHSGVGASRE
jgi:multiple RNA-binding domain-containing protein 1